MGLVSSSEMSNPHVLDSSFWDAALENYHWDRLEAAYEQIKEWGIGEAGAHLRWYRVIEAETITRQQSKIEPINGWLSLEYVPKEILDRDALTERIVGACEAVAVRLDWNHSEKTLLSILAEETDAPWAAHPYGYCIHKEPYEKICLPSYLVDDPEEFAQAVAHEYAHVISEALADGYSPRWLDEALSVLLEQRFDEETRRQFETKRIPWLSPSDLELTLEGRSDEESGKETVWQAYQQAGWIGRYLTSLREETHFALLLRKVADESGLWNFRRMLKGQDRVDAALRAIYGISMNQLFERSFDFMKGQRA